MDKSLWIASAKENRDSLMLRKDIEAEICIIGAGLTGLTTAYYLTKQGKEVVILEKDEIGMHTSGNTTGKITSQHDLFYNYLINSINRDYAKGYLEANEVAIKEIEKIVKEENIDCDFEMQDAYVFTQDEKYLNEIKKEVEAVKSLGFDAEYVNKIDLPIENYKHVLGAIKFPNQAQFNSYKYMLGLANRIEENKGIIYENSKVIDLAKKDDEYIVKTNEGSVKAKYVVIASHYPIINYPGLYFLKMYQEISYLIAIETDMPLFEGMYINCEIPTISFRTALYNGKRIVVVGGMTHKTGKQEETKYNYNELEKVAKKIYPDCKVIFKWNTEDCISLDKIPYIGEFSDLMPNVFVGTGYKKWGMTTSNIAANIISDKILGKENKYEKIFDSKRLKPIKNHKELGNMIKEVGESLIIKRLKSTDKTLADMKENEGKIIEYNDEKVGAYKDMNGNIYLVAPYCSHLGCELSWNDLDKTWDCPCHGSRFNYDGKNLYDPAIKDLEIKMIKKETTNM